MMERSTGRILRSLSGFYDVQTPQGLITCRARGILRRGDNVPLTGDMVEVSVEKGKGMVEKILPRRNHFIRPAVANVDTDEYDIPDDYDDIIDDCMYYGHTGHWDEQAYCDYMNAADEDGNWKHPYDIDI